MTPFEASLHADIAANGPMPLAEYMRRCNAEYYANHAALGRDFTTAPEISQTFGELIGLWCADLWQRAGSPDPFRLIELGPGRGVMMQDMLRAMAEVPGFCQAARVELVEFSPTLRAEQRARVPDATWSDSFRDLPWRHDRPDAPAIIIANEYLDAIPVSAWHLTGTGWQERRVDVVDGKLAPTTLPAESDFGSSIPEGYNPDGHLYIQEWAPTQVELAMVRHVGHGGALLVIDYGAPGAAKEDTLQAIYNGQPSSPWEHPGESDLTVHVDFDEIVSEAGGGMDGVHGPVTQRDFLLRLGLRERTDALKAAADLPTRAKLEAAFHRLTHPAQMGTLFKVMALTAPGWPTPAGFA